jgi:hypothetical protein
VEVKEEALEEGKDVVVAEERTKKTNLCPSPSPLPPSSLGQPSTTITTTHSSKDVVVAEEGAKEASLCPSPSPIQIYSSSNTACTACSTDTDGKG